VKTALVHTDAYTRFDYGPHHPLRMERLALTWRLMQAYGIARLPGALLVEPTPAPETEIEVFHTREYIDMLKSADSGRPPSGAEAFGLGAGDNPVFPGLWEAARYVAAGSIIAADLVGGGRADRAFHFAGGLHHALSDRASGFCYVNDPVLAIARLRMQGLRVAYVDIDAHHGDGVQWAFYHDPSVLTISTHERGDRLFPGTGFVPELGEGDGRGFSVNVPLDAYTDSATFLRAFDEVVPAMLRAFRPDVVVAQLGIDSHRTDPLTHLALTVQGFARAVRRILDLSPRVVALGGGGYNLPNVARAWTAAWAAMNEVALSPEIPARSRTDLARHGLAVMSLWDPDAEIPAEARRWAADYAGRQVKAIRDSIFPLHGL
jgi:acetoin utilization protein AcuC